MRMVQALENRTLDSKREMDIMNALDEMKSLKSRQEKYSSEQLLAALTRSAEDDKAALDAKEEAQVCLQPSLVSSLLSYCQGHAAYSHVLRPSNAKPPDYFSLIPEKYGTGSPQRPAYLLDPCLSPR